jgi:hypothetical protein
MRYGISSSKKLPHPERERSEQSKDALCRPSPAAEKPSDQAVRFGEASSRRLK